MSILSVDLSYLLLTHHSVPFINLVLVLSIISGSYLLAKKVGVTDEGLDIFHMTAFEIPYGYAVYTEPGAIHDDATTQGTGNFSKSYLLSHHLKTTLPPLLIPTIFFHPQGTWRVGYINAHKYSTVLLCNKTNDILDIAIERMHLTPI